MSEFGPNKTRRLAASPIGYINLNYSAIFWMCFAIAILGFVWRRINLAFNCDFLSPFNLLYWFWVCPLVLRGLNLSPLETNWTLEAITGISLVTFSLISVSLLPALIGLGTRSFAATAPRFVEIGRQLNHPACNMLLILLFAADFSLYIYTEFIMNPGGFLLLSALFGDIDARSGGEFYNFFKEADTRPAYASLVLIFTSFLSIFGAIFYLKFRFAKKLAHKLIFLFIAIQPFVFGIIKLSKIDATLPFLILMMTEFYYRQFCVPTVKKTWLRSFCSLALVIVPVSALVVLIFYSTAVFRVGETLENVMAFQWLQIQVDDPSILSIVITYIYAYTALNFENAARFITSYSGDYHVGASVFRPVLSLILQGRVADDMLKGIDHDTITPGFIAGTFIPLVFAELKWIGLLIIPPVYAMLINGIYLSFRRTPSLIPLLLYLNFAFCWIFLFFSNAFGTLGFYTNAIFIVILGSTVAKLSKRKVLLAD